MGIVVIVAVMKRSHRIALKPTPEQEALFGQHTGYARFAYNWAVPVQAAQDAPNTVRVDGKVVILPKISQVVMVEHLRFVGSIREVTINRTAGTWFASFCIEDGQEQPSVKDGPIIGVDVVVGTMATCSDGTTVGNPKVLIDALGRLRRLDKAIADAGMAGFLVKLEYKCARYGARFEKADRWFPSSRLCADCGWHNAQMTLSDREWRCGVCGTLNDRDFNAALNLERWPGLSFPVSGRGDCVSSVSRGRWSAKRQRTLRPSASRQSRD